MKLALKPWLKPLGVLLLAGTVASMPSVASAHRDWDGRNWDNRDTIVVVPRHRYKDHYKSYKKPYHPRVVKKYYYYEPYVIERHVPRVYEFRPRVYDYYYAPRYPSGNLELSIDLPFRF